MYGQVGKVLAIDWEEATDIIVAFLGQGLEGVWVLLKPKDLLEDMQQGCFVSTPSSRHDKEVRKNNEEELLLWSYKSMK